MLKDLLKSIMIGVGGFAVTLLSSSLLIRIIPFFGKLLLVIGFGLILFGFFSFLFNLFRSRN